jgi:hypothetical protein
MDWILILLLVLSLPTIVAIVRWLAVRSGRPPEGDG